jgi:hypothetical protein
MSGRLTIEMRAPGGALIARRRIANVITKDGKTLVARMFSGTVSASPGLAIAVGGGSTPASEDDTALEQPLDRAAAPTPAVAEAAQDDGTARIAATVTATLPPLGAGETQDLREAGIVVTLPNQPEVLYNRVVFPVVTRSEHLELTLTWEVTF